MRSLGRMISILILLVNIVFAALMILSAYSSYISPEKYPLISCSGLAFPLFLLLNIGFLLFWCIFRYKFALVSVITIILCVPQIRIYVPFNFHSEDLPSRRIKVLSYNVMAFNNMEMTNGENSILQYLAKSNADIICLQEYASSSTEGKFVNDTYINDMMRSYPYRDVTLIGVGDSGNRMALFSRFPILSSRRVAYKSDYNGSVCYELAVEGDTVTLINNHLESNKLTLKDRQNYLNLLDSLKSETARANKRSLLRKFTDASVKRAGQARAIADAIDRSPHKSVIVCGDFNDGPLSYAHHIIAQKMNDAFVQSGRGFGISYNRSRFYFRIDNILVSHNMKSYNCVVDRSIKDSDHYPIWCYISIKSPS
jgi:endonuclease/exonuclease/phosphatase family metal-dependent hydrolase